MYQSKTVTCRTKATNVACLVIKNAEFIALVARLSQKLSKSHTSKRGDAKTENLIPRVHNKPRRSPKKECPQDQIEINPAGIQREVSGVLFLQNHLACRRIRAGVEAVKIYAGGEAARIILQMVITRVHRSINQRVDELAIQIVNRQFNVTRNR